MEGMKALFGKLRRGRGFAVLEVAMIVAVFAVILLVASLVRHDSSPAAPKHKVVTVTFDTPTMALVGPNCSYPTPSGCFIPTDAQAKTLNKISAEGYAMAHVTGKGYIDYEKVPGTVPNAPAKATKALHVTEVSTSKGTGQKQK